MSLHLIEYLLVESFKYEVSSFKDIMCVFKLKAHRVERLKIDPSTHVAVRKPDAASREREIDGQPSLRISESLILRSYIET